VVAAAVLQVRQQCGVEGGGSEVRAVQAAVQAGASEGRRQQARQLPASAVLQMAHVKRDGARSGRRVARAAGENLSIQERR